MGNALYDKKSEELKERGLSGEDLEKALKTKARIIGINARNLDAPGMPVSLDNIMNLIGDVPKGRIIVAESGIETKSDVERLAKGGARSMLVGTTLMKAKKIGEKIRELCIKL